MPSNPRRSSSSAILGAAAVIAAGSIGALLLSSDSGLRPDDRHRHHLRTSYDGRGDRRRRRLLFLSGDFNDPKTVELRPAVNNMVRSDVNIMEQIGAPMGDPNRQEIVFAPNDGGGSQQARSERFFASAVEEALGGNNFGEQHAAAAELDVTSDDGGPMTNGPDLDPRQQAAAASAMADDRQQAAAELEAMSGVQAELEAMNDAQEAAAAAGSDGIAMADQGVSIEEQAAAIDEQIAAVDRPIPPYDIDNALATLKGFRYTLFFLVYDQATDTFTIVHNIPGCDNGCQRVYRVASFVALALRKNFPRRFQGGENISFSDKDGVTQRGDFVAMLSTGDVPRIYAACLRGPNYCGSADFAPILNFGSVYTDPNYLPSMIAMPLPVRPHAPCFDEWQATNFGEDYGVCSDLRPKTDFRDGSIQGGLVFGKELGMMNNAGTTGMSYWDELVPQIIWRGTDFVFLHTMFPEMRAPDYQLDIAPKEGDLYSIQDEDERRRWAIKTLWEMGDEKLLPRWRGVLMTSEAELEASIQERETNSPALPWINVKFASINVNGIKVPAAQNEDYRVLQRMGISAIGDHMDMTQQAKYKYHIDLGGGGGTTWTGTIEKLALPGVLFHHVTPTKDWFHDLLVPWEHYIPVRTDLSDLREKFEWAESHPKEAKEIAENGTRFARWMGGTKGFGKLYENHVVAPLSKVLGAYRALPPQYAGKSVLDVIAESGREGLTIVGRCSGLHMNSCEKLF